MSGVCVNRASFKGDYLWESRGKRYNRIFVELACKSTYNIVDVFQRGTIIVETENFSIPLWKLFLLQCQKDYFVNPNLSTLVRWANELGNYPGIRYNRKDSSFWNGNVFTIDVPKSSFFRIRTANVNGGTYSVPSYTPFDFRVSLIETDDERNVICPKYIGVVRQNDSYTVKFDTVKEIHLTPNFIYGFGGSYMQWADNMGVNFGEGNVFVGEMFPYLNAFNNSIIDENPLWGYFGKGKELVLSNCFVSSDSAIDDDYKQLEIWTV